MNGTKKNSKRTNVTDACHREEVIRQMADE